MQIKSLFETDIPTILLLRRKALRLNQADVAKKLGLSAMGLSYLETGKRELKLTLLEKWTKVLGLEVFIEVKPK
ncbi:MAG: helix-turn-helix transcriptional regulator [Nanoarchaeota archaeon]